MAETTCRYRWLQRQGLLASERQAKPCGECPSCAEAAATASAQRTSTVPAAPDAGDTVREVKRALGAGDRHEASKLLRHAVHLGTDPADLFEAAVALDSPKTQARSRAGKPGSLPSDGE